MQCLAKSDAWFADQSPDGVAFISAHHLSLPISGEQAVMVNIKNNAIEPAINLFIAVMSCSRKSGLSGYSNFTIECH